MANSFWAPSACPHLDGEQPLVIREDTVGVDVPLEPRREQRVPHDTLAEPRGCPAPSPHANAHLLCRERNCITQSSDRTCLQRGCTVTCLQRALPKQGHGMPGVKPHPHQNF